MLLSHFPSVYSSSGPGVFPVVEVFAAVEKWRGLMRSRFGVSRESDVVDFVWSSILRGYDGSQSNFSAWVYALVNVYHPDVTVELDTDNHTVEALEPRQLAVDQDTLQVWLRDWFDDALHLSVSSLSVSVDLVNALVSSVSVLSGILSRVVASVELEQSFRTLYRLFGEDASTVLALYASNPLFWVRQATISAQPMVTRETAIPVSRYRDRWLSGQDLPSTQEVFTVDLTPAFEVYSGISLDPLPFTDAQASPLCFMVGESAFVRTPFGKLVALEDFPSFDPAGDASTFVSAFELLLCRVFSAGILSRDGLSVTFSRVNRFQTTYLPIIYGGHTFPFVGIPCRSG